LDTRVIAQDCLGYLMEPLDLSRDSAPVPQPAAT